MNTCSMNARQKPKQNGFVLVTSLIFLVVVTLLAVAAINRSTLQEMIASNTRARETAQQNADAALRAGETLLKNAFDSYQEPGADVDVTFNNGAGSISKNIRIWYQNNIPVSASSGQKVSKADEFLIDAVWDDDGQGPIKYNNTSGDTLAKYYIEELQGCYQTNLNPNACATGSGIVMYRITARAEQGNATVITQSTFAKYY